MSFCCSFTQSCADGLYRWTSVPKKPLVRQSIVEAAEPTTPSPKSPFTKHQTHAHNPPAQKDWSTGAETNVYSETFNQYPLNPKP